MNQTKCCSKCEWKGVENRFSRARCSNCKCHAPKAEPEYYKDNNGGFHYSTPQPPKAEFRGESYSPEYIREYFSTPQSLGVDHVHNLDSKEFRGKTYCSDCVNPPQSLGDWELEMAKKFWPHGMQSLAISVIPAEILSFVRVVISRATEAAKKEGLNRMSGEGAFELGYKQGAAEAEIDFGKRIKNGKKQWYDGEEYIRLIDLLTPPTKE